MAAGRRDGRQAAAWSRLRRTSAHLRKLNTGASTAAATSSVDIDPRGTGPGSPFAGSHFRSRASGGDSLDKHLDTPPVVLPAELGASAPPLLLDDLDLQRFLVEGYCAVKVECGAIPLHEEVCSRLDAVVGAEGNPTNNLLARVPAVQQVLDHPAVRGALQSLLGEGYVLGPHRYVHTTKPGSGNGGYHKDCYGAGAWGCDHMLRHPRPTMLMGLYYPHEVTAPHSPSLSLPLPLPVTRTRTRQQVSIENGPTCIIPRRSAYESISTADPAKVTEPELPLVCAGGTIIFTPFDTWHRPSSNVGTTRRHLLKFHFHRYAQPTASPNRGGPWLLPPLRPVGTLPAPHASAVTAAADQLIAQSTYEWMCGRGASAGMLGDTLLDSELRELQSNLHSADEATRLHAAYRLANSAAHTNGVVEVLVDALRKQVTAAAAGIVWDEGDWIEAARPPADLHGTNPTALSAAQGLAAAGSVGTAALTALLQEEGSGSHWLLRVHALDALSLQGCSPGGDALESTMLSLLVHEVREGMCLKCAPATNRAGRVSDSLSVSFSNSGS